MPRRKKEDHKAKAVRIADAAVEQVECELGSTWPETPEQVALEAFIDAFETLLSDWQSRLAELVEEGNDG